MRKTGTWLYGAFVSVLLFLAGLTVAMANHPGGNVAVKDTNGNAITDGKTPYSPKQSCGLTGTCHVELGGTPTTGGHNYGSGEKFSTHVQGVLDSDNQVYWQAYQNKSFEHGVSVGRHMNEGRNEDYTNANRAAVGDPFFTSSLGMFGKY